MDKKTALVLKGFINLNNEQQKKVLEEINNYLKQTLTEQKYLRDSIEKRASIVLGPTGGGCPCCGK